MATSANEALLDSWQLSLHGKAPRTVRLYLDEARRFAGWLAEHGRPAANPGDLLAVDRRDAEAWLTSLKAAGRAQPPCGTGGLRFGTSTGGRWPRRRSRSARWRGSWWPSGTRRPPTC